MILSIPVIPSVLHAISVVCVLAMQPTPAEDPARAFMDSLAQKDTTIDSMTGEVRYTSIQALESDIQIRKGHLFLTTDHENDQRAYAVRFDSLQLDDRLSDIREHFIFDGRWFVERLPDEHQFNKRELVAADQKLDPMELMREAPFWVSLGRNTDRVFDSYTIELLDHTLGLVDNRDFPEFKFLVDFLDESGPTQQIKLTPKPGSGFEDDWEWVRIWFNKDTLLPQLYVKADWTGDMQIVQLFEVQTNTDLDPSLFDTTTPPPESGWRVQISPWRGEVETTTNSQTLEYKVVEPTP